jgi:hypothetical protein
MSGITEGRKDTHKYRIEIPNEVDDAGLTVYAFRLYAHIKRVAGDRGFCSQGTRTLARVCKMSTGEVVKSKKELAGAKLIKIKQAGEGYNRTDRIYVVNIWQHNYNRYNKEKLATERSPDEHNVHDMNEVFTTRTERSSDEHKKERDKKEPTEEEPVGVGGTPPARRLQAKPCDAEFLEELQSDTSYEDLDVLYVYQKMIAWCKQKGKQPTRNRLIHWLNSENRPISGGTRDVNIIKQSKIGGRNRRTADAQSESPTGVESGGDAIRAFDFNRETRRTA